MKVNFYSFDEINDSELRFAVIVARHKNKWVFVRNKKRTTWEIPGGHREQNEDIVDTASRELFEETGAVDFNLRPICVYSVKWEENEKVEYTESFGGLFYADIEDIGELPESEVGEVRLYEYQPDELTYAKVHPYLFSKVKELIHI